MVVTGVRETWRLEWKGTPAPYCEPGEGSLTCPCTGFAYGEAGDLYVVRVQDGREIDRLRLVPFFQEQDYKAVVQRWPADDERDYDLYEREDFSEIVSRRPTVQLMQFADYDHDGHATEFYLQTESAPCGKSVGIVVGVSANNPRLHAFSSISSPTRPLYLQRREWEALRKASSGFVTVIDWPCGDHGADTQTENQLNWFAAGIKVLQREYSCPSGKQKRKLLSKKAL